MIILRPEQVRFAVEQALSTEDQLSLGQRAKLYAQVALLLDGRAAEQAAHQAFLYRESERNQLKFRELLKS
jgi:hypothetical protein